MNKLFKQTNGQSVTSQPSSIPKKAKIQSLKNHYFDIHNESHQGSKLENTEGIISPAFTPKKMTPKKTKNIDIGTRTPDTKFKPSSFDGTRGTKFAEDELDSCFANANANLFITPQKPKKDLKTLRSRLLDTATTTTSTPINFIRSNFTFPPLLIFAEIENNSFLEIEPEKRNGKKEMIVDDWAIYTEIYVKKNIIMNEFFKLVRPTSQNNLVNNESSDGRTRKRLKLESLC